MATKFVNQVDFSIPVTPSYDGAAVKSLHWMEKSDEMFSAAHVITPEERESILASLDNANWIPVSVTGMKDNYVEGDPIGSWRASNYTPEYANVLWNRIKDQLPKTRVFDENSNTDWDHHETWEPIGVSPLLRFIKYTDEGYLVVHYDGPYVESDDVRTLQSFVIYLDHTDTLKGGATRFLHDPQYGVPVEDRNLDDQPRQASDDEVIMSFTSFGESGFESFADPTGGFPVEDGSGIIFDHRLLHEGQICRGEGQKIIIRTDIMYRKVKSNDSSH